MKKTLYPKTKRISNSKAVITEKIDGSNLGIFKINDKIYFAQRNNIFSFDELKNNHSYKGLTSWANENKSSLNMIHEGSGVFGEWIGMGILKYPELKKFQIFAKFNIDLEFEIRNLNYDRDLFIYPFENQEIPDCIGVVPLVDSLVCNISIDKLDSLYDSYCEKIKRDCEGFIIYMNKSISKYVRKKNGKPSAHKQ